MLQLWMEAPSIVCTAKETIMKASCTASWSKCTRNWSKDCCTWRKRSCHEFQTNHGELPFFGAVVMSDIFFDFSQCPQKNLHLCPEFLLQFNHGLLFWWQKKSGKPTSWGKGSLSPSIYRVLAPSQVVVFFGRAATAKSMPSWERSNKSSDTSQVGCCNFDGPIDELMMTETPLLNLKNAEKWLGLRIVVVCNTVFFETWQGVM